MSDNREKIFFQYDNGLSEDGRHGWSRSQSLEFHYTKKALDGYISKNTRILEIGCATGYYGMYFADKCGEYVGIDLFPPHIELFRRKIAENNLTNVSCRAGDAVNLGDFGDESFDVVLCLGPMYHLPPEERELAAAECARVCKPGGIAAFAYINKVGVYAGACVGNERTRAVYPNAKANEYVLRKGTDDIKPGVFYFTMPEDMESLAKKHGLIKLSNTGTDFFITMDAVNAMDDEKFEIFMELADEMSKYESCTGMSNHALLICKRS